jgi:predicted nucleotidyltransferase
MSDKKDYLSPTQQRALGELKQRLNSQFDYIERLILYGSTARGNSDDESDIDLLVITAEPLSRFGRHKITNIVFEVNLKHGTNISTMVVDLFSWEKGVVSVLPIKKAISRDGIAI